MPAHPPLRKIDVHTHILPQGWPELAERFGYGGWVQFRQHTECGARLLIDDELFREVLANCWDPQVRLSDCDHAGVDLQVLSTVPVMFSYWAKPHDALCVAQLLNDHIAGVVSQHPLRFAGLGTLPMQSPELAVRELERCVNELGLAGIEIGTHINDWNLDAPQVVEVLQAAEQLGAAVFVHPWDMMGSERMPRYWLPWLVGMPAESSLAICSMIFGGVFERLPDLRTLFAHGGGAFPFTFGRIEHGYRVRPDLCAASSGLSPRDCLGRFYVDSLVHDRDALRLLIRLLGEESIAMGSDYPFPLGEHQPGELIESAPDLSAETKHRLLAGNAAEFLNLAIEHAAQNEPEGLPHHETHGR